MEIPPPMIEIAKRLVAELMPIAVITAGDGADAFAAALRRAGSVAETLTPDTAAGVFDLAILLAAPHSIAEPGAHAMIAQLAQASDRVLFAPTATPTLPILTAWFEAFAELDYQPVVDFDAGFAGQGAFLVDRQATAAETDLDDFADRLSMGGELAASASRVAALEAELGAGDRHTLKSELAAKQLQIAALTETLAGLNARLQAAETLAAELEAQNTGWDALRRWVWYAVARPQPDPVAALRAALGTTPRQSWFRRRSKPTKAEAALLRQIELLRASPEFDAAWYIACNPEIAEGAQDPVLHHVLRAKG